MIKFTFYRWAHCVLGARSFKKITGEKKSYAIVKRGSTDLVNILISQGFVEEWPRDNQMLMEEDNG